MNLNPKLLDMLACPVTKEPVELSLDKTEFISRSANLAYPIVDGIPIMLASSARTLTVDEQLKSNS